MVVCYAASWCVATAAPGPRGDAHTSPSPRVRFAEESQHRRDRRPAYGTASTKAGARSEARVGAILIGNTCGKCATSTEEGAAAQEATRGLGG